MGFWWSGRLGVSVLQLAVLRFVVGRLLFGWRIAACCVNVLESHARRSESSCLRFDVTDRPVHHGGPHGNP